MGLDQYLDKRTYVKNWDHMKPNERHTITVQGRHAADIKPERISYIIEEVAYWRKANAIHKWFVSHVQGGKDDCGSYYVSREKLTELKAACDKVLANSKMRSGKVNVGSVSKAGGPFQPVVEDGEVITDPQIAETVLPTAKGFFFGSTDYDQYYHQDLQKTSEVVAAILAEADSGDFYYHSSW